MKHDPVDTGKKSYATKAKVEFAVRMARDVAGIDKIGGLEFAPDGTIRVFRAQDVRGQTQSVDDEIAEWRANRRKG